MAGYCQPHYSGVTAKTSNEKRTQLKQQCREALAAHIYDRLGLVIEPSQAICKELGQSLKAVTPETLQNGLSQAAEISENDISEPDSTEEGSFTAKIRELEAANHDLRCELDQTGTRLESSLDESRNLRAKNYTLEREVETIMSTLRQQGEELARLRGGINQAMETLQGHCPQNPIVPRDESAAAED